MAIQQTQSQSPNYGTNRQNSPWERMLTQMLMAQRLGSRGMAGFALGQILSGLLRDWKQRYDFRGDMKDRFFNLTPEDRAAELEKLRQQNPQYANQAEAFIRERLGDQAFPVQSPVQQQAQITPQVSAPIRQAAQQVMPTDFQPQQGLLGTNPDWEETLKRFTAVPRYGWNSGLGAY